MVGQLAKLLKLSMRDSKLDWEGAKAVGHICPNHGSCPSMRFFNLCILQASVGIRLVSIFEFAPAGRAIARGRLKTVEYQLFQAAVHRQPSGLAIYVDLMHVLAHFHHEPQASLTQYIVMNGDIRLPLQRARETLKL